MRPGGFEPPTHGLEVRRYTHKNAGSAACSSQIFGGFAEILLSGKFAYVFSSKATLRRSANSLETNTAEIGAEPRRSLASA